MKHIFYFFKGLVYAPIIFLRILVAFPLIIIALIYSLGAGNNDVADSKLGRIINKILSMG